MDLMEKGNKPQVFNCPVVTNQGYPIQQAYGGVDDSINLLDVTRLLWKHKNAIVAIAVLIAVLGGILSMILPNKYKAELIMRPSKLYSSKSGQSQAGQGLSTIGALMGVSLGGEQDSDTKYNLATLQSHIFAEWVVTHNNLVQVLNTPPKAVADPKQQFENAVDGLMKAMKVTTEKDNTIKIEVTYFDSKRAVDLANILFNSINEYTRQKEIARDKLAIDYVTQQIDKTSLMDVRQVLFSIISDKTRQMVLAETQNDYAFEVIDPPVINKSPTGLGKLQVVALSGVTGFVLGILILLGYGILSEQVGAAPVRQK